jgi:hypothetical protein
MSVLFFGPGLLIDTVNTAFTKYRRPTKKRTAYHVAFEIVINSTVVFAVTIQAANIAAATIGPPFVPVTSLSSLIGKIDGLPFLYLYILLTAVMCLLWLLVLNTLVKAVLKKYVNRHLAEEASVIEHEQSVWENLFFPKLDKGEKRHWLVASFYKDGEHLVSGVVARHSGDDENRHTYQIFHSDTVERLLREEKDKNPNERIVGPAYTDYLDHEAGTMIRFYRCREKRLAEETRKHWDGAQSSDGGSGTGGIGLTRPVGS